GGHHHDRQVGKPLLDLAEQLQSVHAWHVDVGEDRDQRRLDFHPRAGPTPPRRKGAVAASSAHLPRHAGQWGRVATWSSEHGWSGNGRTDAEWISSAKPRTVPPVSGTVAVSVACYFSGRR